MSELEEDTKNINLKKDISFKEVLKSSKIRDKFDKTRKYGPLKTKIDIAKQ